MKQIGLFNVNTRIAQIIDKNVTIHPTKPMTFLISDSNCKYNQMVSKMMELQKYFKKYGVKIKEVDYNGNGIECMKLVVEITDPLAGSIESYKG